MVRALRNIRDSMYDTFSEALSRLQKRGPEAKLSVETIKIVRGLVTLAIAVGLAFVSHTVSRRSAILAWRSSHWESRVTWELLLHQWGFQKNSQLEKYLYLFRSEPLLFTEESILWVTEDACSIYIHQSPYQPGAELWICQGKPPKQRWINLGSGLDAFDRLIQFFETHPHRSAAPKRSIPIDPKELRY